MKTSKIYLNSNTWQIIDKDIKNNTLSHTYLLILPDKILANDFAKFFAMQIFCKHQNFCLNCPNCLKILHDNMGDVKYFPKKDRLSVEESRQVVADSYVLPYELNKKLFILNDFDKATPQSQNALLKVLEEPTSSNMFLLIAESETTILNTILSRSKKIIEHTVDEKLMEEYLHQSYADAKKDIIEQALYVANGNLTKADDIIVNKKYQELINDVKDIISTLKSSADVLKASCKLYKHKDNFNQVLDVMMQMFLDIKIAITTKQINPNLGFSDAVISSFTPSAITKIAKNIIECKNKLKFNCSTYGVIDYLLFGILEAKFVCK